MQVFYLNFYKYSIKYYNIMLSKHKKHKKQIINKNSMLWFFNISANIFTFFDQTLNDFCLIYVCFGLIFMDFNVKIIILLSITP